MSWYLLIRYLHFLFILLMYGFLFFQLFATRKEVTYEEVKKLALSDILYGISAIIVVILGLTLWFLVGKPSEFYTQNPLFHIKYSIFIAVALLSLYPTLFYNQKLKQMSAKQTIGVPKRIRVIIWVEVILLLFIPFLAVLMANGISF